MNGTEAWFGTAALLGLLAAGWQRLRSWLYRLTSLLVVNVKVEGEAHRALAAYCWAHFRRSPFGERWYSGYQAFVRPLRRYQLVIHERTATEGTVYWQGWRPLMLKQSTAPVSSPHAGDTKAEVTLTFLRGTFDVDTLLLAAAALYNTREFKAPDVKRYRVLRRRGSGSQARRRGYAGSDDAKPMAVDGLRDQADALARLGDVRFLGVDQADIGEGGEGDPWQALALPASMAVVIEEARRWKASEHWYRSKQIPWRRGWLCTGGPGSGKTSTARAIARDLDLPVYVFDLASMSNDELVSHWHELSSSAPCMALVEDIDGVFQGRQNRLGEEGGGLTFDCLLNCISGIETADGIFIVITTNNPADIDPALGVADSAGRSSRPGRIDRIIEFGPLDEDCRRRLAARILDDCPQYVEDVVADTVGATGAQVTDACARIALAEYWKAGRGATPGSNGHVNRLVGLAVEPGTVTRVQLPGMETAPCNPS